MFPESIVMKREPGMACCWSNAAAELGEPQAIFPLVILNARDLGVIKSKLRSF